MAEDKEAGSRLPAGRVTRREFARRAALASAAVAWTPQSAISGVLPAINPQEPAANAQKIPPEAQAEADWRVQTILARHGAQLTPEQQDEVRRLTGELQKTLETLRKAELANGDSPALYLKPLVERPKKPVAAPAKPAPKPGRRS